jgi:hypothetical protein
LSKKKVRDYNSSDKPILKRGGGGFGAFLVHGWWIAMGYFQATYVNGLRN